MDTNRFLHKCGEILVDIKSKNKNKMYIFQCTICDIQCDQLKKFSLHIGEEHLNDFDKILKEAQELKETEIPKEIDFLKETELKFEAEPEELKLPTFNSVEETPDIKIFANPIDAEVNVNPDPLDTLNTASTNQNNENLNCEIKYEIIEHDDEYIVGDGGVIDGTVSISDSDKSDSDEEFMEEVPHKKRKIVKNSAKKGKTAKQKESANDSDSDGSKDAECNAKKEAKAIKKHKRCKSRWKNIDDSIIPLLIEIYKKYEVLWQVEDIAFGILPKRNETFDKMLEELKSTHNFNKNLDELQDHIDYLNYIFYRDREQELKCELNKSEFKPATKYYKDLAFLSDSQGPFKCTNCNEIISKYDRYHVHVAQHKGTIPFQCRLCEMGFQKFDNYLRHVTRHLGINSYHCDVCGKGYPFKSELDWHLTSHTGQKPYLCPICGAGFRARHGYDNHIRRHEKRFRYECHICKHGFNHLCKLNTHIKSHLNIRDVICNVCGKGFTAAKYLQRHKLIHEEEKRYKCNVCGKAFAQDSGLRTHRKQHQPYAAIAENKNSLNKCS